jgi:hypothetical protein
MPVDIRSSSIITVGQALQKKPAGTSITRGKYQCVAPLARPALGCRKARWHTSAAEGPEITARDCGAFVVETVAGRFLKEPQISTGFSRFCHNPLSCKHLEIGHLAKSGLSSLGAGGPQFKSACPDHFKSISCSCRAASCPYPLDNQQQISFRSYELCGLPIGFSGILAAQRGNAMAEKDDPYRDMAAVYDEMAAGPEIQKF